MSEFKESVWCEVSIDSEEKLLIGVVYKIPNCEARNQEMLNKLITQAIERGYKHTVIVGDFNFPEITPSFQVYRILKRQFPVSTCTFKYQT